jgi:hypothetical protein
MNPDFLDLLRCFIAADVRFLIVGAYAVALHGHPRATGDLDVWIEPSPDNAERVFRALAEFGAPMAALEPGDLAQRGTFRMGHPPFQIDILTDATGVRFDQAWDGRVTQVVEGLPVPFIGLQALLQNKRASGRPQDLADVAALEDL